MSSKLTVELSSDLMKQIRAVVASGVYEDAAQFVSHAVAAKLEELTGIPVRAGAGARGKARQKILDYLKDTPGPHDPVEVCLRLGLDPRTTSETLLALFRENIINMVLSAEWVMSKESL